MVELASGKPDTLTRLHIISCLTWQREGRRSLQRQRAKLLDILETLLGYMETSKDASATLRHFHLGGQTILLDDVISVRPSLMALLAIYNAGGRLSIGPWYVQTDSLMVSGEALVRNLLLGRADLIRHGMKFSTVALLPDLSQYTAQIPQILRGFGIEAAFVSLTQPHMPLPFRWQAPDGSDIIAIPYRETDTAAQAVALQRDMQPDGPFVWINRCENEINLVPKINAPFGLPVFHSTLVEYVKALRGEFPDAMRPLLQGEVQLETSIPNAGRYSARIPLKQLNAQAQSLLTYFAERLTAISFVHGAYLHQENGRALLDYSWRELLANQALPLLSGACSDPVSDEVRARTRRVEDVANHLCETALDRLPGKRTTSSIASSVRETYVAVWNPHARAVEQGVSLQVPLPKNVYPQTLLDPQQKEVPFCWENGTLHFKASTPPVGYSLYTLKLTDEHIDPQRLKTVQDGERIHTHNGLIYVTNGQLNWQMQNRTLNDVFNLQNGGDAGSVMQYNIPTPDVVVQAGMAERSEVEVSQVFERLILQHRMRIAPGLNEGRRERGVRLLEIKTSITAYKDLPGLSFRVWFQNIAHDHRLRAHLRTGLRPDHLMVDGPFGAIRRMFPPTGSIGLQPMHSACGVAGSMAMLGLFTRGLHEIEPIKVDGQLTLALTLLRSTGWLDAERTQAVPGAQHTHEIAAEFMLCPLTANDPAGFLHMAQTYQAPLQAYPYSEAPAEKQRSYLTLSDTRILLTALKPPQSGKGLIVRLLNPTHAPIDVTLSPLAKLTQAWRVSLAEVAHSEMTLHDGKVKLTIDPHQIVTLRLQFADA